MPRSYATEFPEFTATDIPAELLDATQWQDMSWHNESCPRFISVQRIVFGKGTEFYACVWVEKPNREDREEESHHRYSLMLLGYNNGEPTFFEGNEWLNSEEWGRIADELAALPFTTTEGR
jgi:hypothetical protein